MIADRLPARNHGADALGDRQPGILVVLHVEREQAVDIAIDGEPGFPLKQSYDGGFLGARVLLSRATQRENAGNDQHNANCTHDRISKSCNSA